MNQPNNQNVSLPRPLRELHLFAGAGGGLLGGMLLGHTYVCAVEIEPYCRKVLFQRQRDGILPKFPIWDDVRNFDGIPLRGKIDVICGGFPCTDISPARTNSAKNGKQAGLAGKHSGLWYEYKRIVGEIRPRSAFIENSPHLRTRGLVTILQGLAEIGYDAKWCVLGSGHVGADHERERMWILATDPHQSQLEGGCIPGGIYEEHANAVSADRRENKPGMERVAHGMAHWMDRLKAIGNGQDPFVAALAYRILSGEETIGHRTGV